MFIPENIVLQVKNTVDLVDIISETVNLKRAGKNYIGLCPFHTEKTPSFTVNPEKRIFHCYGCGIGGDSISFVMKQEGFSFIETVQALAKRYGIDIPLKKMAPGERQKIQEREWLFQVNDKAMSFFHQSLFPEPNNPGMAYFQKRRLSEKIIADFKLGYVADSWDSLLRVLRAAKFPDRLAEDAGLIVGKKSGGFYDRFRNRVIFPIFDINDHVIGFGGRVMDDSKPKYLNSSESAIFNKSRSLYGLNRARQPIRNQKSVFIVEGYMDVLSLYQQGFENTVATLGTALTLEQVRILRGYAKTFYLVYDSDNAGIKAAQRSVGIFSKEYVDARIIILPEGHDPDSFIRTHGSQAFLDQTQKALKIVPFLIESAISRYGLSVEGKMHIVNALKITLANLEDTVGRSLYIKELAERIQIDEVAVQEVVRNVKMAQSVNMPRAVGMHGDDARAVNREAGKNRTSNSASSLVIGQDYYRFEKRILTMMLQFPDILNEINQRSVLDLFENEIFKKIGHLIISQCRNNDFQVSDLVSCAPDTKQKRVITELSIEEEEWDYAGCMKLLGQFIDSRKRSDNSLAEQIKAAENRKDYELLMKLLKQKQHQARQMVSNNMEFSGGDFI